MTDRSISRDLRALGSLLVVSALVHAPLARADARIMEVSNCNGGSSLIVIPGEDDIPGKKGSDCAKACHAANDRRSKQPGKKSGAHC